MGAKSRGNFKPGMCLKECANRDRKAGSGTYCEACIRFSLFKALNSKDRTASSPSEGSV